MKPRLRLLPIVALLSLLAALCLASCGGGGTTTVTVTTPAESESAEDSAEPSAEDEAGEEDAAELHEKLEAELAAEEEGSEASTRTGECAEMGIGVPPFKSGKCVEDGTTSVVAGMHETLVLKSLKAKVTGTKERHTIHGEFGEEEDASGIYVTFDVDLTNLEHRPLSLEENQAVLVLDENEYRQDFEVQNGKETKSFIWQGNVAPQETMHGSITFDVPSAILKKDLSADGNLDFVNLGSEVYEGEFFEQPEIGYIQLYK
jgi:hypothetical protein